MVRNPIEPSPFLKNTLLACKKAFVYVGLFSCIVNILTLTVSLYMFQIFDRVLSSHSYDTLIYLTLVAIFALTILAVLDGVRSRILVYVSHWLDNTLSPEALQRSVDNLLQGSAYASQSLKDISQIRSFLSSSGMLSIMDAPWLPIYLLVIFLLHPALGVLGVLGTIVLVALAIANEKITRPIILTANTASIKSQAQLSSTLRNAESIQAMGMLPSIIQRWFKENESVLDLQSLANERSNFILAVSKFTRYALQVLVLGLGAFLVVNNHLTSGGMIAASIILSRALAPIEGAISVWQQFTSVRQAYSRLNEYFSKPVPRTGAITLPRPQGFLAFENVSLVPPGSNKVVLRNISFLLNPGEMLAVIGPSAAGKSCLARLTVGAWAPSAGNVRLDNADVYTWNREDFGTYLGYLPQSIELFSATVKENIARMKEANDQDIIEAAKIAGAHDMILRLPDGYDTKLGDGGYKLSGGQTQRIALARALYGNPQLVVLDEPNSNLDSEGDLALVNALMHAKSKGITVVFIAHRPSLVELSDKILLLRDGVVQLFGSKAEVMARLQEMNIIKGAPVPPSKG